MRRAAGPREAHSGIGAAGQAALPFPHSILVGVQIRCRAWDVRQCCSKCKGQAEQRDLVIAKGQRLAVRVDRRDSLDIAQELSERAVYLEHYIGVSGCYHLCITAELDGI